MLIVFGLLLAQKSQAQELAFTHPNELSIGFCQGKMADVRIYTPPPPLFWNASHKAHSGFMLAYQRLMFHTLEHVSFYLGASAVRWLVDTNTMYGITGLLVLRLWAWQSPIASPYFFYSVASPTYLSHQHIGQANLGSRFIFQDILGVGAQIGTSPAFLLEAKIIHYSNGYVFPVNSGFDVPLVVTLGHVF